jgi:phage baseplate assembly protein W
MQKRVLPTSLKKVTSKDFDLSFRSHPSTGKLLVKKDDDAVKQALKNLILTNKYERPFRPEYGGDIRRRLFDLFDSIDRSDFESRLKTVIKNYEPRAILDSFSVSVKEYPDMNSLSVTISYRNAITLADVVVDVNLNKVR